MPIRLKKKGPRRFVIRAKAKKAKSGAKVKSGAKKQTPLARAQTHARALKPLSNWIEYNRDQFMSEQHRKHYKASIAKLGPFAKGVAESFKAARRPMSDISSWVRGCWQVETRMSPEMAEIHGGGQLLEWMVRRIVAGKTIPAEKKKFVIKWYSQKEIDKW